MRIFKYSLLFLILTIIAIVIYTPLTYKPSHSLSNLSELVGVIHVHSNLSDGRLPPERIAEEAKKSGLDFVFLTDHGNPNLKVIEREGKMNGVFIISGSEISLFDGVLLALGVQKPSYKISPVAEEAIDDIEELGGLSIVAHPFGKNNRWKRWELEGINGIEIMDLDDEIREKGILKIFNALIFYPLNSRFSLLSLIERPTEELKIWDEKIKNEKIYGFYGLNLHGKIGIFPFSYSKVFNLMRIHIPIKGKKPEKFEEGKKIILEALKEGNFFSAIDGAGESRGFRFYGIEEGREKEMGRELGTGSIILIQLPFKSKFEATVFKDGKKFFSTKDKEARLKVKEKGIYRVEVYLQDNPALKKDVPWIISNPIFVGREEKTSKKMERKWEKVSFPDLKKLIPENDPSSEGRVILSKEFITWDYRLGLSSPSRPHVWCALALREKFSLEGFKGLGIEAKSSPSSRAWLQIRDRQNGEERWWSVSIKLKKEFEEKIYRFDDFRLVEGKGEKINLKNLEGFFIIIDKGSMREGSKGEIKIKSIFKVK